MEIGIFQLLSAKRQQVTVGRQYVDSLANYWKARARFMLLMSGRLPPESLRSVEAVATGSAGAGERTTGATE